MSNIARSFAPSGYRNVGTTCCLALLCGLAPAALALAPKAGEPVAVLALRPAAALAAAVAAGTEILSMSAGGRVVVLRAATDDLAAALRRDPTILVLAAAPLAGCLPGPPPIHSPIGAGGR